MGTSWTHGPYLTLPYLQGGQDFTPEAVSAWPNAHPGM